MFGFSHSILKKLKNRLLPPAAGQPFGQTKASNQSLAAGEAVSPVGHVYWSSLRNKYAGRPGFVIGNGPSLTVADLDCLKGEVTIASNKIYLAFDQTSWRPTVYSVADFLVMEKVRDEIFNHVSIVHCPPSGRSVFGDNKRIRVWNDLGPYSTDPSYPLFSDDVTYGLFGGYSITFQNLQIAVALGLNPIYIIGCNHYYAGEGDIKPDQKVAATQTNHFMPNYRQKGELVNPAPIEKMTEAFLSAARYAEQNGIEIINITRGGHLEAFPRASADDILNKKQVASKTQDQQNSENELVSVCIPTRNSEEFLEACLQSVADQDYPNIELIITDGESNDNTLAIIEKFRSKIDRMKVISEKPEGIYQGLNASIKAASGDFIYILMSDDTILPGGISAFKEALDTYPDCDIAHSQLKIIDAEGKETVGSWQSRPMQRFLGDLVNKWHMRVAPHDSVCVLALGNAYTSLTQMMVRASVYEKAGYFSCDHGPFGDYEWQMRACMHHSTIFIPKELATWRRHEKQASQNDRHFAGRLSGHFAEINERHFQNLCKKHPHLAALISESGVHRAYINDHERVRRAVDSGKYNGERIPGPEDVQLIKKVEHQIGLESLRISLE